MNWTGGALGRGSNNAKTSLSAAQKRHFAKARARLPNNRPSPRSFQYLDFPAFGKSARPASNKARSHTSIEDDYDAYPQQTVVPQLPERRQDTPKRRRTPIKQEQEEHTIAPQLSERHQDTPKRGRAPIKQEQEEQETVCSIPSTSLPIFISSGASSSSSSDADEDVAPAQVSLPEVSCDKDLDAQRQRFLAMNDWVGLERHTKPVKIGFANEEDRDLIGKRRCLSQRPPMYNDRHASQQKRPKRTSYFERPRHEHYQASDYVSQADISVRIGSAVDRSMRDERARRSLSKHSHRSLQSDEMLLDEVVHDQNQDVLGSEHLLRSPSPVWTPRMTHRNQYRALTPSAFMDDAQSSPEGHQYDENEEQQIVTAEQNKLPDTDLPQELKQLQDASLERSSPFRLVFEHTPQPYEEALLKSSSPVVRDFTYEQTKTYLTPSRTYMASSTHDSDRTDARVEKFETHSITSLSPKSCEEPTHTNGQSADQREYQDSCTMLPQATQQAVTEGVGSDKELEKQQKQIDEENAWKTMLDMVSDESNDNPLAPAPNIVVAEPLDQKAPDKNADEAAPDDAQQKFQEEQEKIWRSFLFSDDDPSREWTIEEPDEQSLPNYQPAATQPSMMAEVATSPLTQNPHLAEEVCTSPSVDHGKASMVAEASVSTEMDLWAGSHKSDAAQQPSSSSRTTLPSENASFEDCNAPSLVAEAPSSAQEPTEKLNGSKIHRRERTPSSIAVQAPTTPHPTNTTLAQPTPSSETDELAPSPAPKLPIRRSTATALSVVFKKPRRYVGDSSLEAPEPIHIGRRVLRNGKRMKEVDIEGEGDDIVDD